MSLLVVPSKVRGVAPRISDVMVRASVAAFPIVVSPLAFKASATVKAPFTVEVTVEREMESEVALAVPRLRAAAESMVSAPAEVDQVEAAPAVRVKAPPEVKEDAPVGVRLTLPAPEAVKFPEVRVKAMLVAPEVVIAAPLLYAVCKVTVGIEVTHDAQVMFPKASMASGAEAETATVPEAFGKVMVLEVEVGSVMAKTVFTASAVVPSKESGEAPVMLPFARLMFPVVTVKAFEAVRVPADVMVPVPVVLMLFEVLIELVVAIEPKPEAMEPEARAPTVVTEVVTTFEAKVVPEMSAAALTVMVAFGKVMVLFETVGSVMAKMV